MMPRFVGSAKLWRDKLSRWEVMNLRRVEESHHPTYDRYLHWTGSIASNEKRWRWCGVFEQPRGRQTEWAGSSERRPQLSELQPSYDGPRWAEPDFHLATTSVRKSYVLLGIYLNKHNPFPISGYILFSAPRINKCWQRSESSPNM